MGNLSWSIGRVRVTRIAETVVPMSPSALFPEATPEALDRHRDWLAPHWLDEDGRFPLSIHALVIESGRRRILVDTCVGDRLLPGWEALSSISSTFLQDLAEAGFPGESIDTVLCTHMHFDHVGWNTRRVEGRWVPTFANARYLFARAEWEHWNAHRGEPYTESFEEAVVPVLDAGQADLVEMNHRVDEAVWLEPTPGHTPGHVAIRIASEGHDALVTGDLNHHPVQWAEPQWGVPADWDAKQAEETRRRVLREHGDRSTLVIGTHYAPPCAGYLERAGARGGDPGDAGADVGWRFRPPR